MKKIIYTLLLLMGVGFSATQASAQPRYNAPVYRGVHVESFFYYPKSNVYYSFRTHQYIYPSRGGWQITYRLPRNIRIGKEDRVKVEHRGFDVWTDNARHQYAYAKRYQPAPAIVYTPDHRYNGY